MACKALLAIALIASTAIANAQPSAERALRVLVGKHEGPLVQKAAQEVQRYLYLRSGQFPELSHQTDSLTADSILIGKAAQTLMSSRGLHVAMDNAEQHVLRTLQTEAGPVHAVYGATDVAVLHAAYHFCELQGIRFRLHGDVVPSPRTWRGVVAVNVSASPRFSTRGLHPFHDFAEGPDWWTVDDYKVVFAQMAKMRMNFFGLHTYPWAADIAATGTNEPTVWVGLPDAVRPDGSVDPSQSYPTSYQSTLRAQWAYTAINTSNFTFGGKYMFERDCYGSPVHAAFCPFPATPADSATVFNNTGAFFRDAFANARALGLRTCVGNEAPLTKPFHKNDHSSREFFQGVFDRIMKTYPIDHYWLWTPERWEWDQQTVNSTDFKTAVADFAALLQAHDDVQANFTLATCGWVLGPLPNRSIFDQVLSPRFVAMSSLDEDLGRSPVDPAYKEVAHHNKWAIPWMEDDPGLTVSQLWVNRTLEHIADALSYSIEGMIGIHWRTVAVSPQVAAMASASWDPLTSEQFWLDWARTEFEAEDPLAQQLAAIFSSIDSFSMPRPVDWVNGPGGLASNPAQCALYNSTYGFVDDLCSLEPSISSPGAKARFTYWCSSFLYMQEVSHFECVWSQYDAVMEKIKKALPTERKSLAQKLALPLRIEMVTLATKFMTLQLQTVRSRGEMGTFYNILSHSLSHAFDDSVAQLLSYLELKELPTEAIPPMAYAGPDRLVVPTARSSIDSSEMYKLQAFVLSEPVFSGSVALFVRPLGSTGAFTALNMHRLVAGRAVFEITFSPQTLQPPGSFEYYVQAGPSLTWPPGAPAVRQTVIVSSP